ncbi:Retrovirus-related Pol polyprotein from transposon 17.6, partial [Mucuna pruriens]
MEDETLGKRSTLILGRPFLMTVKTKIDVHAGTLSMEFGDTLVQFNIFEAMKNPVKDTSIFGIDLIDKLVKEHMQANIDSTEFFQVARNIDIIDCLGSVFEEPNYDEPWELHDAKDTTTLAHLDHDSKNIDLFDQVRKNEKPECSKHAKVQVVGTTKQQSAQVANIFAKNEPANIGRDWMKTESTSVTRIEAKSDWTMQPRADTNTAKEDWKQARIKAESESANQHEEQSKAGIMPATKVPDSNQVGQTVSRPISDVSPPKPPIELKPLLDNLKILREEEARPVRQQQRRLNPTIVDVVKKEVTKLLAARIIYPILDSNWIHIAPEDQYKTTFTCPFGTFAYTRMSFGLYNAPSTFQRCMLSIFLDLLEDCMEVFMDDFTVYANTFDACLRNLARVLKQCTKTNLVLNFEKCHFMVIEGIVLGHLVSSRGIEVDKAKIDIITSLPNPASVWERFIKNFSKTALSLSKLL